jgi:hypothetical protein
MAIPDFLAKPTTGTQANAGVPFDVNELLKSMSIESLLGGTQTGTQAGVDYGLANPNGPTAPGGQGGSWLDNMSGYGAAASGAASVGSLLLGFRALSEQKDQNKFNKGVTNRNLSNQAKTTNSSLEDRQARRVDASGPGQYQSVSDYMAANGVDGSKI